MGLRGSSSSFVALLRNLMTRRRKRWWEAGACEIITLAGFSLHLEICSQLLSLWLRGK